MDPHQYSIEILRGRGITDEDHVRSFLNFIRRVILSNDDLPETPDELMSCFEGGPSPYLYNIIYASKYGSRYKINEFGYAETSSAGIATKIWYIASDWQSLITGKKTPKQAMLSLTQHRLTGSREAATSLEYYPRREM